MKGNTGKTTKWITEGRTSQTIWNWTDVTTEVTDQTITEETITDATIANWTEATVTSIANTTDNVNGTMVELSGSFLVYNTLVGYISVLFMCIICLLYLYSGETSVVWLLSIESLMHMSSLHSQCSAPWRSVCSAVRCWDVVEVCSVVARPTAPVSTISLRPDNAKRTMLSNSNTSKSRATRPRWRTVRELPRKGLRSSRAHLRRPPCSAGSGRCSRGRE